MLFNTFGFIFGFLPATLVGFFFLSRRGEVFGAGWPASGWLGCVELSNLPSEGVANGQLAWLWCGGLAVIALPLPNTQEIMRNHLTGITITRPSEPPKGFAATAISFSSAPLWVVERSTR
jgi:hypothetical protein